MPFRSIISRDDGTPWPDAGMTTQRWVMEVPIRLVQIPDLIATQPGLLLHALTSTYQPPAEPWTKDAYPHVVQWCGDLYLEDGHHRAVRSLLRGDETMMARVLDLGDA